MSDQNEKKEKAYFLPLFNRRTGKLELIEVDADTFRGYDAERKRFKRSDRRYREHTVSVENPVAEAVRRGDRRVREWIDESDDDIERLVLIEDLRRALTGLPTEELALIKALFFDELTATAYAAEASVWPSTVTRMRDAILKKLREMMD